MTSEVTLSNYLAIAPEIALIVLAVIVLAYERFIKPSERRRIGILTAWGTVVILLLTVGLYLAGEPGADVGLGPSFIWGGMIQHDMVGFIFRLMFLLAVLTTTLVSVDVERLQRSEYYALLLMVTVGLDLMAAGSDLIMLYVALETVSISLYVLAGFVFEERRSVEAGMKYFVYGSFASALMLYGLSWLYGFTGQTNIYNIAQVLLNTSVDPLVPAATLEALDSALLVAAVLIIIGFGFKISLVPFHFWTPDVYEGAPTPVTAFLSTASKAAGFAVFFRVFTAGVFGEAVSTAPWWAMLTAMCIVTMGLGNFLAIWQTNIKRMLAYSSIAQAGYVMIGLVVLTSEGAAASMYYLFLYVVTNIAAFGGIILVSNVTKADDMTDLYGLNRRSPLLALVLMLSLLSLGGIPPTAGFFGKFFLFKAAIEAGYWWLALIGIILAFVALYYYLTVIKYMYLYRSDDEDVSIPVSRAASVGLAITSLGILILGVIPGPVYNLAQTAAQLFYPLN